MLAAILSFPLTNTVPGIPLLREKMSIWSYFIPAFIPVLPRRETKPGPGTVARIWRVKV